MSLRPATMRIYHEPFIQILSQCNNPKLFISFHCLYSLCIFEIVEQLLLLLITDPPVLFTVLTRLTVVALLGTGHYHAFEDVRAYTRLLIAPSHSPSSAAKLDRNPALFNFDLCFCCFRNFESQRVY